MTLKHSGTQNGRAFVGNGATEMHREPVAELDQILSLLAESGLPVSDISRAHLPLFFGIQSDSGLIAVIGLELFGTVGLLRSLAVSKACRGQRFGRQLVDFAEHYAAECGAETLFLLTTTAAVFFQQLGYNQVARADVPHAIRSTSQFSSLCPASSVVLSKKVAGFTPTSCSRGMPAISLLTDELMREAGNRRHP